MRIFPLTQRVVVLALITLLTLTACGGGDDDAGQGSATANPGDATADASCEARNQADATVAPKFFGMHVQRLTADEGAVGWPELPVGAFRVWDSGITWRQMQFQEGPISFGGLDAQVELAEQHDAEVLMVLGPKIPTWASTKPDEDNQFGKGAIATPKPEPWETFIEAVATRYKGRICAYEVWNEPNLAKFYSGTPQEMADLTARAASVLKRVDPGIAVVAPAVSARTAGSDTWLESYLTAGAHEHIDIVSMHHYPLPGEPPEATFPDLNGLRSILEKHGLGEKPLWNSETAFGVAAGGTEKIIIAGEEAAALVARTHLTALAVGMERVYWYAWDDRSFGGLYLLDEARENPTEAAAAYRTIAAWLEGHKIGPCTTGSVDSPWSCTVAGSDVSGTIAWHPSASAAFTPPKGASAVCALDGSSEDLGGASSVDVGTSPVFIVTDGDCPEVT